jgi:5-methylcytosine-specific restriction endonuclease McrA
MTPISPENRARYPKDWPAIRARILARAGNKCEGCGVANGTWRERADCEFLHVKVVLTIAHLNHVPEDCRPDNLRAWCQRCHNRHDAKHRAANRARTRDRKRKQSTLFEGVQP